VLVHHAEFYGEMRGKSSGRKPSRGTDQVQFLARVPGDGFDNASAPGAAAPPRPSRRIGCELFGEFRQRPELVADFLRQRFRQQRNLLLEQAGTSQSQRLAESWFERDQGTVSVRPVARIARSCRYSSA